MTDTCELVVKYKCGSAFHCGFALIVAVFVGAIVGDVQCILKDQVMMKLMMMKMKMMMMVVVVVIVVVVVVVGDVRIGRSDNQNSCQNLCVTWHCLFTRLVMIRYVSVHDYDNDDDEGDDEEEEKENDENQDENDDDQIRRAGTVGSQRCN